MKLKDESMLIYRTARTETMVSRRLALGSSALAVVGLLSRSTLSQTEKNAPDTKKRAGPQPPKEFQERMEQSKAFSERLRDAKTMEERQHIMNEQMAWQRQRAFDDLKGQLRVSDQEWPVVKRRLQAVYDLVHPVTSMGRNETPKTELEQRSRELGELLGDDKADADQIKAKLTALRAAKSKANQELTTARQTLRQIMNLRQEAVLVLNGLLD